MLERLEQILQLQKMCQYELDQAQRNSERYSSNMKILADKMKANWQGTHYFLTEYDSFITNITSIMEAARKFNLQMHLHNIKLSDVEDIFSKTQPNEKLKQVGNDNISLLKEPLSYVYPAEECDGNSENCDVFVYPTLNLSEVYEENIVISGRVTYIESLRDLSFYIFDKSSEYREKIVELAKSLELRQYHDIPAANEVFGYVLDKHIFRAVLCSKNFYDVEMKEDIFPCYLLDTGEILPLKKDNIMYRLTNEQKCIPAQAVRCQLNISNKNPFVALEEMEDKLQSLEYENCCNFKVVAIDNNTLYVDISDNHCKTGKENGVAIQNNNPYVDNITKRDKTVNENGVAIQNNNPYVDNITKRDKTVNENGLENLTIDNVTLNTDLKKVDRMQLTEDELEMLYEEPLSTCNAMKAVMGYDPQDDKRICRFYDSKSGGCFKGANCKLEHTLRQPDGWTKDVLPASSIIDCRHPTTVFPTGSIINITPTYVGRLDRFYAIINDRHQTTPPLVWNDEDIPSWKLLKKPPHMFELVLSRYIDGLWYRAKIVSHDDDYKMFKVLYVDYGNYQVVHLRNMASIDMTIAQLPFQAVLCRIEAVKENQSLSDDERKNGIELMCEIILNKSMDVTVISHYEDLFVSFLDMNEYPLPDLLVKRGFLEYNRI